MAFMLRSSKTVAGLRGGGRLAGAMRGKPCRSLSGRKCYLILIFNNSDYIKGSSSRSEEHTSELQSLMRISYAVFCLKKKKKQIKNIKQITSTLQYNRH